MATFSTDAISSALVVGQLYSTVCQSGYTSSDISRFEGLHETTPYLFPASRKRPPEPDETGREQGKVKLEVDMGSFSVAGNIIGPSKVHVEIRRCFKS